MSDPRRGTDGHSILCLLRRLAACAAVALAAPTPALAHHGWAWAEDGNSELTGVIVAAKLGNPHGELTLDVGGAKWIVEVGQWDPLESTCRHASLSIL